MIESALERRDRSAAGHFRIRLTLLGRFRLEVPSTGSAPTSCGRRLLALLATRGSMTRAVAAGTLWPDATQRRAQGSLRTTLWRLHRASDRLVVAKGDCLVLDGAVSVDMQAFTLRARRLIEDRTALDNDLEIATMPRGDLLPGWYEEWVLLERERLRQLRLHALEAIARHLCQRGRFAAAIEAALAAIRLEPLRESAHRALITAHLSEHNVSEAVRHLSSFRRLLNTELGVEPSLGLTALVTETIAAHGLRPRSVDQ